MLYPTVNQPIILLALVGVGLASGIIFDLFRILTLFAGNDKFTHHFFDAMATLLSFAALFLTNLKLNFGQFRIYVIAVFLASLALERLLSKFLWTKLLSKWYISITTRKQNAGKKKKVD